MLFRSVFDEEELAVDEVSPPWQVYEWYVTSALVKRFEKDDPGQLIGLPGREKATRALRDNVPLNHIRFLKTASVFGFHGVYRTLAKGIGLLDGVRPGEFGMYLVDTWEKEQGLDGFRVGIKGTPGNEFRSILEEAVRAGLNAGAVAKRWSWDFYNQLADHLVPRKPGKQEAKLLYEELLKGETNSRAEVLQFLQTREGMDALKTGSEKEVHSALLKYGSKNAELLVAIQSYEKVCRLLYNAFYSILQWMDAHSKKATTRQLSALEYVKSACTGLPAAFQEAERNLEPFIAESEMYLRGFADLRESFDPERWVQLLFEHHFTVQKNKPPNGKAAWITEYSADTYLLNTTQGLEVDFTDKYVHQYRTFSLESFLTDLQKS